MKKVLLFLADGFEEVEAMTPVDYLRRAGIEVDMVSIGSGLEVRGAHGIQVLANKTIDQIEENEYDGLVIPGGMPGASNLRDDKRVTGMVKNFNDKGKLVGAICAGPIVLAEAGILEGKKVTSYPGFENQLGHSIYVEEKVVQDNNIITARGPALAVYFALKIIEYFKGKDKVGQVSKSILLD